MAKKLLVIKVGSDIRPACTEDITEIKKQIEPLFKDSGIDVIVTHHAVKLELIDFGD